MRQICHDFYCELFSEPAGRVGTTEQMQEVLGDIPTKVTVEMNAKLSAPIEKEELEQAMKALANEKAPGPNGATIEFFKAYWKLVCDDYLVMTTL
jgi:hypothetical protein